MMTTPALNETATVRDLLFGGMALEPVDALAESLREHGTVNGLGIGFPDLTRVVEREVATEASGLLALNLLDLAVTGWKRYEALIKTARRTREAPKTEEIVALATHRIESSHHPTIELFIDGKSVATIKVDLSVAFDIDGVLAVVSQARLMSIRSGNCTVTGTLAIEKTVLAQRQHPLDLPGAVRLRNGVALLEVAASAGSIEQAVVADTQSKSAPAAWHPDPTRRYEFRWWDGSRWTHRVATEGRTMTDPLVGDPVPAP